jgi:hypothetical protein
MMTSVRLISDDEPFDAAALVQEFPSIRFVCGAGDAAFRIDEIAWRGAFDLGRFDTALDTLRGPLAIRGDDVVGVAFEVLGRYQRRFDRRNAASETTTFEAALSALLALYSKADAEHALDVWQWLLRLDPNSGLVPQLAALFHDIDRLDQPEHERLEHRMRTPGSSAEAAYAVISRLGLVEEASQVAALLSDATCSLLDDADVLSFLSLHSDSYADHFGIAQTRRKVLHAVGRLGLVAREKLVHVRIRPDVERLLHQAAA